MIRHIIFCLVVFLAVHYVEAVSPPKLGGPSELKDVTPEVREIVKKIRPKYETGLNKKLAEFEPVQYRTQTVAGTNYFIKVKVAPGEFIHLRVHQPISDSENLTIHGVLKNKKDSDPLEYFDGNLS